MSAIKGFVEEIKSEFHVKIVRQRARRPLNDDIDLLGEYSLGDGADHRREINGL